MDGDGAVVAVSAAPVEGCRAIVSIPVGEGVLQHVKECAICSALVDEGGTVVADVDGAAIEWGGVSEAAVDEGPVGGVEGRYRRSSCGGRP